MARKLRTGESVEAPDFDFQAALASLQDALANLEQEPATGFLTAKQWAQKWKMSESHCLRLLREGVRVGKVDRRVYKIKTGTVIRPTGHFRVSSTSPQR